jgi:hypothetical protein
MPSGSRWETRRQDDRTAKNADDTEYSAIKNGSCNIEAGILDDRIAGSVEDDYELPSPHKVSAWASMDMALDSAASDLNQEIFRRTSLLGASYPFLADGNVLKYSASRTLVYEFCLAVSQSPSP